MEVEGRQPIGSGSLTEIPDSRRSLYDYRPSPSPPSPFREIGDPFQAPTMDSGRLGRLSRD